MNQVVKKAVLRQLSEYAEYVDALDSEAFGTRMPGRSNEIGQQLWCVIGGHESGVRAIEAGKWAGFDCSLKETRDKGAVLDALRRSSEQVREALDVEEWTPVQERMALFLLEHDAMHQGQLIRFNYALGYPFPQSWVDHWVLTE